MTIRTALLVASATVSVIGVVHTALVLTSASSDTAVSSAPPETDLWILGPYLAIAGVLLYASRRASTPVRPQVPRSLPRRVLIGALVVGGIAVVALGGLWQFQGRLIYYPDSLDPGPVAARVGGGQDPVLQTADGLSLHSWLLPPRGPDRHTAVLYLPGNGGSRLDRLDLATAIADLGYTVLLVDYRGYGGNPGEPGEDGFALDADAAAVYLAEHGFPASRTIYVGESIGTGVAARLAAVRTPAGLVLRSPYTSLDDVARSQASFLPVQLLLRDHFDTLSYLPRIACPIMVVAGDADVLVPVVQSRVVAASSPRLYKEIIVPGAGHNDSRWFDSSFASMVDDLARRVS